MGLYSRSFLSALAACALLAALDLAGLRAGRENPPRLAWFCVEFAVFATAVAAAVAGAAWLGVRLHGFLVSRTAGRVSAAFRRALDIGLWVAIWTGVASPLLLALARDVRTRNGFVRNPWSAALAPWVFPALLLGAALLFAAARAARDERRVASRPRLGALDAALAVFAAACLYVDAHFLLRYYMLYHAVLAMLAFGATALLVSRRLEAGEGAAPRPALDRAILAAALLSVALLFGGAIFRWPPHAEAVMFHTTYARRAASWLHEASDRDRDGFARLFGEGDADDGDPGVNPLAVDRPGDGIDQDGDGRDRTPGEQLALEGRLVRRAGRAPFPHPVRRVLVITIDALRADRLARTTATGPLLPRLRALSAAGVTFTHAHSPTAGTLTSFRSMFAASYAERDSLASFLPRLREIGVRTRFVAPSLMLDFLAPLSAQVATFDERVSAASKVKGMDLVRWGVHLVEPTAPATTDSVLDVFRRQPREPLFVWAHYYDLHQWHDLSAGGPGAATASLDDRYDAVLRGVEAEVGRLLDGLRAAGQLEGTAIIVTGDHGEGLGDHGLRFHTDYVWESVTRVPLIAIVPGVAPRTVVTPVSLVDLGPTIVTLFGGEWRASDGGGLLAVSDSAAAPPAPVFVTELLQAGVVVGDWKLVFGTRGHRFRLFDLARDPGETRNLSEREPARMAELRPLLALHVARSWFSPGPRTDDN